MDLCILQLEEILQTIQPSGFQMCSVESIAAEQGLRGSPGRELGVSKLGRVGSHLLQSTLVSSDIYIRFHRDSV